MSTGSRKLTRRSRIVAVLSVSILISFLAGPFFDNVHSRLVIIEKLDSYQRNATAIAAAATAASVVIAVVPDDYTTPLANQIADICQYTLIATLAITVEKLLFGISGFIVFKLLIPFSAVLGIVFQFFPCAKLLKIIKKLLSLGFVLIFIVPAGVGVSSSIESTIKYTQKIGAVVAEPVGDTEQQDVESAGFFDRVKSFFSKAVGKATDYAAYAQKVLGDFIDAVAALLIISCLIPLLTLLILWTVLKSILGTAFSGDLPEKLPSRLMPRSKAKRAEAND